MGTIRTNEEWLALIKECRSSGLPDKIWCLDHGISTSSFYYNIRRLRKLACSIPEADKKNIVAVTQDVVPLQLNDEEVSGSYSFPASSADTIDPTACISIESHGITVTCRGGVSQFMVCSVIHALQTGCQANCPGLLKFTW